MKSINCKNPVVTSYLLLSVVFFFSGFSNNFFLFLLGAIFIVIGIKETKQ